MKAWKAEVFNKGFCMHVQCFLDSVNLCALINGAYSICIYFIFYNLKDTFCLSSLKEKGEGDPFTSAEERGKSGAEMGLSNN